jgi:hypothetical protein
MRWRMRAGEVRWGQHGGACLYDDSQPGCITFAALEDKRQTALVGPGDVVTVEGEFHRFDPKAGKLYMAYCRVLGVARQETPEDSGAAVPE